MRKARVSRGTSETSIEISINLDGNGVFVGSTGIGFFDHMLSSFAKHSLIDVDLVKCVGDVHVDYHHLVEDVGIVFGKCFDNAIGDKKGIARFGFASVPLDDALSRVSIDIGGRSYLFFDKKILKGRIRDFDMELIEVFFSAFVREAKINVHIELVRGFNLHHIAESVFKSFAIAMKEAIRIVSDIIPSTKDVI
ncbi:MAG: imidazoleglycerol-phosphate dehydratase HisB [Brevinematia bacterium]